MMTGATSSVVGSCVCGKMGALPEQYMRNSASSQHLDGLQITIMMQMAIMMQITIMMQMTVMMQMTIMVQMTIMKLHCQGTCSNCSRGCVKHVARKCLMFD